MSLWKTAKNALTKAGLDGAAIIDHVHWKVYDTTRAQITNRLFVGDRSVLPDMVRLFETGDKIL